MQSSGRIGALRVSQGATSLTATRITGERRVGIGTWECSIQSSPPSFADRLAQSLSQPASSAPAADCRIEITERAGAIHLRATWDQRVLTLEDLASGPEGRRFTLSLRDGICTAGDRYFDDQPALAQDDDGVRVILPDRWDVYAFACFLWLALHAGRYTLLHAAACSAEGCPFLLIGPSGSGKSTLAAALMLQGADVYSDEAVFFSEDGGVFPMARAPRIRPGGWELLNAAGPSEPPPRWTELRPGDPKTELALPPPPTPFPVRPALLFLGSRSSAPALRPMAPGRATRHLLRAVSHRSPSLAERLSLAADLVVELGAWELTVGDPLQTAAYLRGALRDTRRDA